MPTIKRCNGCKHFSPNPYNPKVGACMDSAHDGVYDQVSAMQPRCSGSNNSEWESLEMRNYCPGCKQWLTVGDFKRDKSRINGLSKLCWKCDDERLDSV